MIRLRFIRKGPGCSLIAAFDGVAAPREEDRIEIDGVSYVVESLLWKVDGSMMTVSVTVTTGLAA